jgi:hypothetical protein
MHTFMQDFRYALRTLKRSPSLTLVIVASLAIGIGANTAIFSVVNALLLKPLPYPDPDRLVVLWLRSPGINIPQDWPSPGQYIDIQTQNRSFEEMSISQGRSATLLGFDQPERVEVLMTSSSLFHLLGRGRSMAGCCSPKKTRPASQRSSFSVTDSGSGFSTPIQALSADGHAQWLGRRDRNDKNLFTVVGVLRQDFLLNDEVMPTVASIRQMDVFLPLPFGANAVHRRGDENYNLMARLKPGVTAEQAQADIDVIAATFATRTNVIEPSRSASCHCSRKSSETSGGPCSCCWDR